LWRTDYSVEEWNAAFLGTDPAVLPRCNYGINGITVYNGWWTDTFSVIAAENNLHTNDQPISLDFWRSYTTAAAVAGLPQFNFTDALLKPSRWQFPAWCDPREPGSVPCGVIYLVLSRFEVGVTFAQIVNLNMRLAIYYSFSLDEFYSLVIPRIYAQQHVLCMMANTADLVANDWFQQVMLPTVSPECISAAARGNVSSYDCDFRTVAMSKLNSRALTLQSDYFDVSLLFSRMKFTMQILHEAISKMTTTYQPIDHACKWIKRNPKLWTPWFGVTTPRVYTVELTEAVAVAVYVPAAIFVVCTLAAMAFLFKYRASPIIRRASHLFCQLMMVGACLFYVTLVVGVQPESTGTCTAAQFLFSFAFTLFYGALLIKTLRIYLIFNRKHLQTKQLHDSTMLGYLLAYGAVDLLLVVLWAGVSPPTATLHSDSADAFARIKLCDSENSIVFSTALYVWRGLAVLTGGVLALRIHGVDDDFSESKFLGAACYNIFGVSVVVLGLTLVGPRAPDVTALSGLVGVTVAVFLSCAIFVVPKLHCMFGSKTPVRTLGGQNELESNLTQMHSSIDPAPKSVGPKPRTPLPAVVKLHIKERSQPATPVAQSQAVTPVGACSSSPPACAGHTLVDCDGSGDTFVR